MLEFCARSILYTHVLCKCGRVVLFDILLTMLDTFGKLLGAAGGLGKVVETPWGGWAKKEETIRVSRRSRRRLGEPCGAFGRPLIPFSVPQGALWMIFFIVVPNHVLDGFRMDYSIVLGTSVASFL